MPLPDQVKNNMSIANPTDMAAMKQAGTFQPGMTVRDALGKLGIDVDGPVEQLTEFAKKTVQNKDPLAKMQNMSAGGTPPPPGGTPPPVPEGGPPPGGGAPPPAGLEGLMRR